jgi:hypothetical protein
VADIDEGGYDTVHGLVGKENIMQEIKLRARFDYVAGILAPENNDYTFATADDF